VAVQEAVATMEEGQAAVTAEPAATVVVIMPNAGEFWFHVLA
jgi:hypothetical protein